MEEIENDGIEIKQEVERQFNILSRGCEEIINGGNLRKLENQ